MPSKTSKSTDLQTEVRLCKKALRNPHILQTKRQDMRRRLFIAQNALNELMKKRRVRKANAKKGK